MVDIGKEVHRTPHMKPAEFWIREDVYYTYVCKNCEQETGETNIVKAVKDGRTLLLLAFQVGAGVCRTDAQRAV